MNDKQELEQVLVPRLALRTVLDAPRLQPPGMLETSARAMLRRCLRHDSQAHWYLREPNQPEREVTKAEWVARERAEGFTGSGSASEPSTAAFVGPSGVQGRRDPLSGMVERAGGTPAGSAPVPCHFCSKLISQDVEGRFHATHPADKSPWECYSSAGHMPERLLTGADPDEYQPDEEPPDDAPVEEARPA